jgi:hypothetical protein
MSSNNNNNNWMKNNNNNFLNSFIKQRLEKNKIKVSLSDAVIQFLKTTNLNYVIIGGKAAEYHINKNVNKSKFNKTNILISKSTNDYDVLVKKEDYNIFINELNEYILMYSRNQANYHETVMNNKRIYMIGIRNKNKFLDDIIDIHEYTNKLPNKMYNASSGLYFASKEKIISNLEFSIKHHASSNQPMKSLKRQLRLKLLTT